MKLIRELVEEVSFVTEVKEDGKKDHFIEGIFLMGDIPNRNGRIYPGKVLDKEVDRYVRESIDKNKAYGELNHPNGPTINLDRVSHMIKSLNREGKNFIGKAKITDTPMGNIVKGLLNDGANLGVSSRGMGTLKEKGGVMEVQEDFHLATAADIVSDPSAPDAFVRGVMENVEWVYDEANGIWTQMQVEETKKVLKALTLEQIETRKLKLFENFINSIARKA